jgi:hypothetical protein
MSFVKIPIGVLLHAELKKQHHDTFVPDFSKVHFHDQ